MAEALRAGRPLRKILVSRVAHGETVRQIIQEARRRGIPVQFVERSHFAGGLEAQGVLALAAARATVEIEDVLRQSGVPPTAIDYRVYRAGTA